MVTENIRKQLCDFKRQGIDLKYCISYLVGMICDEYNLTEVILVELKKLGLTNPIFLNAQKMILDLR